MIKESHYLIRQESSSGYTQPPVLIPYVTFSWWLTRCKKLRYLLILFRDIDDKIILKFELTIWVVVSDTIFPSVLSSFKNLRDWLIPPWDIDDQRILQSDWMRDTAAHTQLSLKCYLFWWLSPPKKSKRLIDYFPRYWWSKNNAIWLDKRHNCQHPTKSVSLMCYLFWWLSPCKKSERLIDYFQRS